MLKIKKWKIQHERKLKQMLRQIGVEIISNLVDWQKHVVIPCKEYIKSEKFTLMNKLRNNDLPFCYTCDMFFDAFMIRFLQEKLKKIIVDHLPIEI